jgi:hypothetical protein
MGPSLDERGFNNEGHAFLTASFLAETRRETSAHEKADVKVRMDGMIRSEGAEHDR